MTWWEDVDVVVARLIGLCTVRLQIYYFEVHVYRTAEARVAVALLPFFGGTRAQVGCRLPVCLYVFMCL